MGRFSAGVWFEVDRSVDVVDSTGKVLGQLQPGTRYKSTGENEYWVSVGGADGSRGFVDLRFVRPAADTPAAEPVMSQVPAGAPAAEPQAAPEAAQQADAAAASAAFEGDGRKKWGWLGLAAVLVLAGGAWAVTQVVDGDDEGADDTLVAGSSSTLVTTTTTRATTTSTTTTSTTTTTTLPPIPAFGLPVLVDRFDEATSDFVGSAGEDGKSADWYLDSGLLKVDTVTDDSWFFWTTEGVALPSEYIALAIGGVTQESDPAAITCGLTLQGAEDKVHVFVDQSQQEWRIVIRRPAEDFYGTVASGSSAIINTDWLNWISLYVNGESASLSLNGETVAELSNVVFPGMTEAGMVLDIEAGPAQGCEFDEFWITEAGF